MDPSISYSDAQLDLLSKGLLKAQALAAIARDHSSLAPFLRSIYDSGPDMSDSQYVVLKIYRSNPASNWFVP